MPVCEKIVVLTRRTALEELSNRFGTRAQARFYIEQEAKRIGRTEVAPSFAFYESAERTYQEALERVKAALPRGVRTQFLDSAFLPQFMFGESDLVLILGPDGLVVNAAKYLNGQPVLAVNPDPATIEGVLLPFTTNGLSLSLRRVVEGNCAVRRLAMAEARLSDGQMIRAVNDLFIGRQTHASARYRLHVAGRSEEQSSSGIIVSTGTGSTGWLRSVVAGASHLVAALGGDPGETARTDACRFDPCADELRFFVREPWPSRSTGAEIVHGPIGAGATLEIVSEMPEGGVLFGDGVESDYLPFNSGAVATIALSARKVNLLMP
jgi:NAD kinase